MIQSVSVIIVNWNGRHHLEMCLPALAEQTYPNFEVVLVDNGSTDDSVPYTQERFPDVRIVASSENHGFARGNNIGIRTSSAQFIALLNNDTKPAPNWLTDLVAAANTDPKIGIVASKMLFYDHPDTINSAGICLDRVGIAWDRLGGLPDTPKSNELVEVFGGSGGAVLYRREMLDQIGLFDEDYFAYLEDVDLAWRAQLMGWRAVYVETAVVLHHHSASFIEGSPFKSRLLGRNKVWTILKNYPLMALLRYLPLILLYDAGSIIIALIQRRDPNPFIGRLMAIPHLLKMLHKRRDLQKKRILTAADMLARMEPVVSPATVQQRYRHL
ncbi:MAG: glycosyltransferase family 2 protein [Chloroflexi bacterium]|nr:glycosyltransferase family 2 protein [Chloroflexota bacterium]